MQHNWKSHSAVVADAAGSSRCAVAHRNSSPGIIEVEGCRSVNYRPSLFATFRAYNRNFVL